MIRKFAQNLVPLLVINVNLSTKKKKEKLKKYQRKINEKSNLPDE